ncbi:uncharacterized protein MONBRDRAFT_12205 [Monosiga brevicollis MX1]|uniref:phosphoglycerate mutase (2,3-diphosphoglycerate-dependent) n=1 Tax=Monosiga brevicollis TaxID=81824 RepID=A9VBJ1_MONBE|nr:uncharacterized protein MONBRDRAFT_12205 [Monosiga brevicollis MX1]EDQ85107.1 predicted protein [Monosiga brevicollis MX1]|eukprot:XP_001750111.1 hypothetical protein [Monosiga brevicollis MX1]
MGMCQSAGATAAKKQPGKNQPSVGPTPTLVLLRPGSTAASGEEDPKLDSTGLALAERVGHAMVHEHADFDVVYCSTRRRDVKTTNVVLEAIDRLFLPVEKEANLVETNTAINEAAGPVWELDIRPKLKAGLRVLVVAELPTLACLVSKVDSVPSAVAADLALEPGAAMVYTFDAATMTVQQYTEAPKPAGEPHSDATADEPSEATAPSHPFAARIISAPA